jgi:hypothetical protein
MTSGLYQVPDRLESFVRVRFDEELVEDVVS